MENQQSSFMREQSFEEEQERFEIGPIQEAVNSDPREQRSWQAAEQREYQAGYEGPYDGPAYIQSLGEKITPRRPLMYSGTWLRFVTAGIVLLALAGFMTGRYDGQQGSGYQDNPVAYNNGHWSGPHQGPGGSGDEGLRGPGMDGYGRGRWHHRMHQETSVFEVSDNAKLVVNNFNGSVHVHVGDSNQIVVTSVTHMGRGSVDANAQLIDGNTVAVDVNSPQDDRAPQVDLDITVPEMTNLDIHGARGAIRIDGVNGNVQIVSPAPGNVEPDDSQG